jgi:diaminohydroxyphosphoribosylaminopyrimidine deaminase/5-amino-6-(5-phosphoribosylamino)uracil reductase
MEVTEPDASNLAGYMKRALELAEQGRSSASPNPMVGCVLVRDGRIIGEGWHVRPGEGHAEANALQAAADARGATAFVTLEPCNHTGRTPPCSQALIDAGVERVVIAALDPNPRAAGGVAALRAAGVEVITGVLQGEAERQNEAYFTAQQLGRPFVLYKTAMTLDGKIATRSGQSRWITNEESRSRVQQWRGELDAVAVGVNTVLLDDPQLTSRGTGLRSPVKVLFDSVARTPVDARLFEPDEAGVPARVIIFVSAKANAARVAALRERGAEVITLEGEQGQGRPDIRAALAALLERGVNSVLLEGGGTLAWSFLQAKAVDRVAWFVAPKLLGGNGATPLGGLGVDTMDDAIELSGLTNEWIGSDLLLSGQVVYPAANEGAE